MGLIQVMKHLEDIKEVGHGIAVAFVATVYGVASANIFFLPAANKLRGAHAPGDAAKEMVLEGVIGIVEGLNPTLIRMKLESYNQHGPKPKKAKPAKAARGGKPGAAAAPAPNRAASGRAGGRRSGRTAMKRRKPAAHENHERWLVSYADFMTLLFAFFVVMFASTQADKSKAKAVSESVKEALEHGEFSAAISVVLGRGKHESSTSAGRQGRPERRSAAHAPPAGAPGTPPRPADLVQSLATLQKGLDAELKSGKVHVRLEVRGLVITLQEAAFFASGDDALAPNNIPTLVENRRGGARRSQPAPAGGLHGFHPHPQLALPQQLGAVHGPQHRHARIAAAAVRHPALAHDRGRLRGKRAGRR